MTPTPELTTALTDGPDRAAPLVMICCYCPDFDRTAPFNSGASHGICPACIERFEAPSRRPVSDLERTVENAQRGR